MVDKPYETSYGLLTFTTTLMRAVLVRTRYECKVIDLDRTSIAAAIGNHGGLLHIDYCSNAQRLLEVGVRAPADVCDQ